MLRIFLAAAAVSIGLAGAASAVTVAAYDFRAPDNSQPNLPSATLTDNGITIEVTPTGGLIRQTIRGYGVTGAPEAASIGLGESLTFSLISDKVFSTATTVIFERGPEPESFGVVVDGVETVFNIPAGNGISTTVFDVSSLVAGATSFEIRGREISSGDDVPNRRGIIVQELTIGVVPVPLPPAMLGMVVGLGSLGVVSRRRRRSALGAAKS